MPSALDMIAHITASTHPDTAHVSVSIGLLRQLEQQAKGGPIARAVLTTVDKTPAGAAA